VSFEIANGLTKMMKKKIINTQEKMIDIIRNFKKIPIKMIGVDLEKSLEIVWKYKIYAYDAFYSQWGLIPRTRLRGGGLRRLELVKH
jgi:predicted nucleic acid-binding protein